jgi:hypothetical protein
LSSLQPDALFQVVRLTPSRIELIDEDLGWGCAGDRGVAINVRIKNTQCSSQDRLDRKDRRETLQQSRSNSGSGGEHRFV